MPRKGHTLHRDVLADPVYNSKLVTKLVNSIMLDGKKGIAQKTLSLRRAARKQQKYLKRL